MNNGSWLMAHGSRIMARGSWLMAYGAWLMAHGPWLMAGGQGAPQVRVPSRLFFLGHEASAMSIEP